MAFTYQTFLKRGIDLAPLGWETEGAFIPYFCTPRGAKVLGWAGVDGIHYCTIRGFGEMIFAVSPMNIGDYVHPIARNFEDLLRLLLSCTDMAALEQCYAWDEEQYKAFLMDYPATPEQQAVLDAIRAKTNLEPMEDAFHYVKQLQASFDLSAIPYTEDYYDEDMNPAAPKGTPQWKVIFDGGFWDHPKGRRPGKEIPVNTQFDWAGRYWIIPSVYSCSKGLVVDFCMQVESANILAFMDKWHLSADADKEQFTWEQRMQMELDNPCIWIFTPSSAERERAPFFSWLWNILHSLSAGPLRPRQSRIPNRRWPTISSTQLWDGSSNASATPGQPGKSRRSSICR